MWDHPARSILSREGPGNSSFVLQLRFPRCTQNSAVAYVISNILNLIDLVPPLVVGQSEIVHPHKPSINPCAHFSAARQRSGWKLGGSLVPKLASWVRNVRLAGPGRLMDDTVWGAVFPEGLEACAHLHMSQTHLA